MVAKPVLKYWSIFTEKSAKYYRSGIHGTENGQLIFATGRQGVFYSINQGDNWLRFSDEKFYSVRLTDKRAYFSGKKRKVMVFDIQSIRVVSKK